MVKYSKKFVLGFILGIAFLFTFTFAGTSFAFIWAGPLNDMTITSVQIQNTAVTPGYYISVVYNNDAYYGTYKISPILASADVSRIIAVALSAIASGSRVQFDLISNGSGGYNIQGIIMIAQ